MRESRELYQSGDEVMAGVYRDLKTGHLVRIYQDNDKLPEPEHGITTYEWISGNPHWDEEETELK